MLTDANTCGIINKINTICNKVLKYELGTIKKNNCDAKNICLIGNTCDQYGNEIDAILLILTKYIITLLVIL